MQKDISQLISRVIVGEASAQDEIDLIAWFEENEDNPALYADNERLLNAIDIVINKHKWDFKGAFIKFKEDTRNHKKIEYRGLGIRKIYPVLLRITAIILIFISIGSLAFYLVKDFSGSGIPEEFEVNVPFGSRSNLILSDGSTVWLNAGSRLTYSGDFGERNRIVTLEGEAFFEVNKESRKPFTVMTSQLEIVALGTSFNVKSYPEEEVIQTTLVSGSLLVSRSEYKSAEKGIILEPNQQITFFKESNDLVLSDTKAAEMRSEKQGSNDFERSADSSAPRILLSKGVDPEIFTSWKDNKLILDNESFENIAVKLERRFGAKIVINDEELKRKRFVGSFDEITMEQALSALQFASPFEYYIQDNIIHITKK